MYILPNPVSAEALGIPIETSGYSSFFNGRVGNEAFIFGNDQLVRRLGRCEQWFIDGTFKTRPMRDVLARVIKTENIFFQKCAIF